MQEGFGQWAQLPGVEFFERNTETGEMRAGPGILQLHGLDAGQQVPRYPDYLNLVHPDDRDRVSVFAAEAAVESEAPEASWRVIHPDGTLRWLRCQAGTEETDGTLLLRGVMADVTEQRLAEITLAAHRAIRAARSPWDGTRSWDRLVAGVAGALNAHNGRLELNLGSDGEPLAEWEHPDDGMASPDERDRIRVPVRHNEQTLGSLVLTGPFLGSLSDPLAETVTEIGHEIGALVAHHRPDLPGAALTPREAEILQLAADGHTTDAIAHQLHISPSTVKRHFEHLHTKLGVQSRAGAVAAGFRLGIIS